MNLAELYEIQRGLDDHIEQEHPRQEGEDRLADKILALQTELGECANEWRGFKFWRKDREPRINHTEIYFVNGENEHGPRQKLTNPLLEEYADCLHFGLSIGNEMDTDIEKNFPIRTERDIREQFKMLYHFISELTFIAEDCSFYEKLMSWLLGLGGMFGFTWDQVEEAYMQKNKLNHQRQESGY
ncbi:hypothetical protein GCM10011391_28270 [Pullulanibacillus camelliae]|uniref:dUTPase n=1 Tax=Pullulanibacillus camelliae TaxID=1707096 RepID=A0A8J2YJE6_9BACL|nr:dUTP diphosphatase [Pullulanibacillus camelliae]GGE47857.1 hypothetical protein GCM10011391_28270 [Pullulanibacillus camelliae]